MDLLAWLVPLMASLLLGAIIWLVKIAMDYTGVKKDLEVALRDLDRLEKGFEENKQWNRGEHEKLYNSRNDLEKAIIEMGATLKNMDDKIQEILDRERQRNGGH